MRWNNPVATPGAPRCRGRRSWRALCRWLRLAAVLACLHGCGGEPAAKLADGGSLRFSERTGQWLVINYWAEWCAPCREEIPELNELHDRRLEYGVDVLGVNYDEVRGDKLVELIEQMGIRFPVLVDDPRHRWGYEQPEVLPVTVVIGPDGQLRERLRGPQTLKTLLATMHPPG